jgi:CO dehydrogenase maturation factor
MEYHIQNLLVETGTYDLLTMGRPEGAGCYCYANSLCTKFIDFMVKEYDYVVIDNEAGMEHLSRLLMKDIDLLLVVSDPSLRGIRTAGRIKELVEEINLRVGTLALVINRAIDGKLVDEAYKLINEIGIELAGVIPDDPLIAKFDREGKPTIKLPADSIAYRGVEEIMPKIFPHQK